MYPVGPGSTLWGSCTCPRMTKVGYPIWPQTWLAHMTHSRWTPLSPCQQEYHQDQRAEAQEGWRHVWSSSSFYHFQGPAQFFMILGSQRDAQRGPQSLDLLAILTSSGVVGGHVTGWVAPAWGLDPSQPSCLPPRFWLAWCRLGHPHMEGTLGLPRDAGPMECVKALL